jgi:hypothetical protein
MAELLVPGPSRLEVELAIVHFKKYKSPGSDQIPVELIQAGVEMFAISLRLFCYFSFCSGVTLVKVILRTTPEEKLSRVKIE